LLLAAVEEHMTREFQVQIRQMGKQLHPAEVHQTDLVQVVHLEMAATDQALAGEVAAADLQAMVEIHIKDQALAEVHLQMAARVEIPLLVILHLVVLVAAEEHMGVQAAAVVAVDIQAAAEARKTTQLQLAAAVDHS
jgi:hypothetical protein